jgi:hypothetical protein
METMKDFLEILDFIIGTILLGLVGFFLSWKAQQRANDQMQRELFREFNDRYDKLNDILWEIFSSGKPLKDIKEAATSDEKSKRQQKALNDYLNLCAEEHYWYKKGRIDDLIWNSWHAGMRFWYDNLQALRELWSAELEEKHNCKSYYLKEGEDFFKP